MYAGSSAGLSAIQFTTRSLSRQKPMGSMSASRRARRGAAAAISHATMPPNEWPTITASSSFRAVSSSS